MNRIRGKSSRVRQASMVAPSRRSIPLVVEVVKGGGRVCHDQLQRKGLQRKPRVPTMPIPIKKIRPSPQEQSVMLDSSWEVFMYERITAARMLQVLRSMSRSDQVSSAAEQPQQSMHVTQEHHLHHSGCTVGPSEQPSAVDAEEFAVEGVFVLDDDAA